MAFSIHKEFKTNGAECRYESIFKDEDGTSYLSHSSEQNITQHIDLLTDEYLDVEGSYVRTLIQD